MILITGLSAMLIFLPAPFKFLFTSYWADMAVIPLFAALIFLEVLSDTSGELTERAEKNIPILQTTVIIAGCLTDYLFFSVVVILLLKRIWLGQIAGTAKQIVRQSLLFLAPVIITLSVLLIYFALCQSLPLFFFKGFGHSIIGAYVEGEYDILTIMEKHVPRFMGVSAVFLAPAFIVLTACSTIAEKICSSRRINRDVSRIPLLSTMILLIFPCVLHSIILTNHAAECCYSTLKHSIWFSMAFSLIPLYFLLLMKQYFGKYKTIIYNTSAALIFTAICIYLGIHAKASTELFGRPSDQVRILGRALQKKLEPDDFLVSANQMHLEDHFNLAAVSTGFPWMLDNSFLRQYKRLFEDGIPLSFIPRSEVVLTLQKYKLLPADKSDEYHPPATVKILVRQDRPLLNAPWIRTLLQKNTREEKLPEARLVTVSTEDFLKGISTTLAGSRSALEN
jgi:hypothetical protein